MTTATPGAPDGQPLDEDQVDPDAGPGLEDLVSGLTVEAVLVPAGDADADDEELEAAAEVIERRANVLGQAEVGVDHGRIGVEIAGVDDDADPDALGDALTRRGELDFRPVLSTTPTGEGQADGDVVVVPGLGQGQEVDYTLGPSIGTSEMVESAESTLSGPGWSVALVFREGPDGIQRLNTMAAECSDLTPECPTGQLAMVLDDEVLSAPILSEPSYRRDEIHISGDFSEDEARGLALVLGGGALALDLEVEDIRAGG